VCHDPPGSTIPYDELRLSHRKANVSIPRIGPHPATRRHELAVGRDSHSVRLPGKSLESTDDFPSAQVPKQDASACPFSPAADEGCAISGHEDCATDGAAQYNPGVFSFAAVPEDKFSTPQSG
jgi:hypothetical protein